RPGPAFLSGAIVAVNGRESNLICMKLLTLVLPSLLTACAGVAEPLPSFQKQVLTDKYFCDGITAGDLNRDGKMDIVAGPFWYQGPDFKSKHEFYPAKE